MTQIRNSTKSKMTQQLIQLRNEIDESLSRLSKSQNIDMTDASKQNLCAFLTLQRFLNSALHSYLLEEGFSSIQMMSPHILYSLNKMISHLSHNDQRHENYIDFSNAKYLRKQRNYELLGKSEEDSVAIMVTLDKTMLENPEIFKELLKAGMTIARINLAHDYPIWRNLVENVRAAEKEMDLEKLDRRCRVYMDLPGPKIRVNDLQKITIPLKINIEKNSQNGYLISRKCKDTPDPNSFLIKINIDEFTNIVAGDMIHFIDAKGRKRHFKVLEVADPTCLKVELNKSTIVNEETIIELNHDKYKIMGLLERDVTIKVSEGDIVRIYKSFNYHGEPKRNGEPASIGITIPEALKNVKLNDKVYFDDGKICAVVVEVNDIYLEVKVTLTQKKVEYIKCHKGINFPDSLVSLSVPAITNMDIQLLLEIMPFVDMVGISFIHHPNDIKIVKRYLNQYQERKIGIIAKIETKNALLSLSKIILEGLDFDLFGVMIARGDLAIEIGYEQLAKAQEGILEICRAAHVPVIWATSILNSMNKKGIPLRAELTDAYMGLRADCIMLNKGPYVTDSVKFLQQLEQLNKDSLLEYRNSVLSFAQNGF